MEINFCRIRVINDLFLNFNFCLGVFFRRAYKCKIEFELGQKTDKGLIYIFII